MRPFELLHHAVSSRGPGLGRPVLYVQLLAKLVELTCSNLSVRHQDSKSPA